MITTMPNSLDAYMNLCNMHNWRESKPPDDLDDWQSAVQSALIDSLAQYEYTMNLGNYVTANDTFDPLDYSVIVAYDRVVADVNTLELIDHPGRINITIRRTDASGVHERQTLFLVHHDPLTKWYIRLVNNLHHTLLAFSDATPWLMTRHSTDI
jgi:hypothetical protein